MKKFFSFLARSEENRHFCVSRYNIINIIDFCLLIFLLAYSLKYFLYLLNFFFDTFIYLNLDFKNFIFSVGESSNNATTTTSIIHQDGGWSNSIKTMFIYGTGALRLQLIRGGTPSSRAFIIGTTLATDAVSRFLNNTINDPEYVKKHYDSWKYMWKDQKEGSVELHVDGDSATSKSLNEAIKYTSEGIEEYINSFLKYVMNILEPILEPISVNYSNEILATQIHHLGIILFVLSILISILILGLLINVLIVINGDKIINFFTNKYIKLYVKWNMKLIGLEVFGLGASILYFMYNLSMGIHFIATHPITGL